MPRLRAEISENIKQNDALQTCTAVHAKEMWNFMNNDDEWSEKLNYINPLLNTMSNFEVQGK
jgi:hypothetical protein